MATLSIRKLDDATKSRLRIQAANHGISMEEEARRILRQSLVPEEEKDRLGTRINQHFAQFGGIDDDIISPRSLPRSAPDFSDTENK